MSLMTQTFRPLSAGEAGTYYHQLTKKEVTPKFLINEYGIKGALIPLIHWNPIWNHRIAIEIAAQLYEDEKHLIPRDKLEIYRKTYQRAWSTMPLKSNKSFSYFVGAVALDALTNTYTQKNLDTLLSITEKLVGDGCFIEGSHYSLYCSSAYDRAFPLLESFYGEDENSETWAKIKQKMEMLTLWQQLISSADGVVASIGDSWYEKSKRWDWLVGTFSYKDMTIQKNEDGWLTIFNHRRTGFALHEHAHADEVLVAKGNKWIIQGSGMPSYKQVMAKPWRWRRPRNHFASESKLDFYSLWRFRKNSVSTRTVNIVKNSVTITDVGKKTIRFPVSDGCQWSQGNGNLFFEYNGFSFVVRGDIKNVKEDYAWQSGSYRVESKIKTLRIKGIDLITTIQEK